MVYYIYIYILYHSSLQLALALVLRDPCESLNEDVQVRLTRARPCTPALPVCLPAGTAP